MKNAINWFEIPTTDLLRAKKFYETIFGIEMQVMEFPNIKMALFPAEEGTVGGALCYNPEFYEVTNRGTLLYLNGNPDLQNVLDKVDNAGGSILTKKTKISDDYGCMAVIIDSEGNRIALHSNV